MRTTYSLRALALLTASAVGAALVAVLFLFYFSGPASAQTTGTTIMVSTKADEDNADGDCSLREAIRAANENTGVDGCAAGSDAEQDAIHFALGGKATIVLGSELVITDDAGLTIDGQKAKIKVSGNDAVRVFDVGPGGKLDLNHLTVANGNSFDGGAIFNTGTLEVTNSTFSGNSAEFGGSISTDNRVSGASAATVTVTNSTFSGNRGRLFSGAIHNIGAPLEVSNSTFSGNSANQGGSSIYNFEATVMLKNTIVANSTALDGTTPQSNCVGTITDGGYNIEDGTSCGLTDPTSKRSTDPLLAKSLGNNGGPTKTIKLLKGSPALNAIPEATNGCGTEITTDQRGVIRPQGEGCEVGAFEKVQ